MMFGHFFEICTMHEKMPKELSGALLSTYDEICSAVAQALVFLHILLKYVGVFFCIALHEMQKSVLNHNRLYDAKFCTCNMTDANHASKKSVKLPWTALQ